MWHCNCIAGGTQATEGRKAHGHHIGPKQADYNTQCDWASGEAASCWSHHCFVVFIDPDWNSPFILQLFQCG